MTDHRYISESKTIHLPSGKQASYVRIGLNQENRIQIDFKVPVVPEREIDVVNLDRRAGQGQGGQDRELDITPQIHVPPPIAKGRPGHIASPDHLLPARPFLSYFSRFFVNGYHADAVA